MGRVLIITESEGADALALLIAEIVFGRSAPEHLTTEEALAVLDAHDAEIGSRVRSAGTIIHRMLNQAIASALADQRNGKTKH